MTRKDIALAVSKKTGLTHAAAEDATKAVFDALAEALVAGESISIFGFGNFSVRERSARTMRDPRTGEKVEVAATKRAAFKASLPLTKAVSGKE